MSLLIATRASAQNGGIVLRNRLFTDTPNMGFSFWTPSNVSEILYGTFFLPDFGDTSKFSSVTMTFTPTTNLTAWSFAGDNGATATAGIVATNVSNMVGARRVDITVVTDSLTASRWMSAGTLSISGIPLASYSIGETYMDALPYDYNNAVITVPSGTRFSGAVTIFDFLPMLATDFVFTPSSTEWFLTFSTTVTTTMLKNHRCTVTATPRKTGVTTSAFTITITTPAISVNTAFTLLPILTPTLIEDTSTDIDDLKYFHPRITSRGLWGTGNWTSTTTTALSEMWNTVATKLMAVRPPFDLDSINGESTLRLFSAAGYHAGRKGVISKPVRLLRSEWWSPVRQVTYFTSLAAALQSDNTDQDYITVILFEYDEIGAESGELIMDMYQKKTLRNNVKLNRTYLNENETFTETSTGYVLTLSRTLLTDDMIPLLNLTPYVSGSVNVTSSDVTAVASTTNSFSFQQNLTLGIKPLKSSLNLTITVNFPDIGSILRKRNYPFEA